MLANVTSMLSAFRPGQAGGTAIARILSGKVNPSGKLAQSWVRSAGQAMSGGAPFLQWRVGKWAANHRGPMDPDGRYYDPYNTHAGAHPTDAAATILDKDLTRKPQPSEAAPLFRFGTGLSYTTFNFSDLTVSQPNHISPTVAMLSVKVRSVGIYCITSRPHATNFVVRTSR